MSITYKSDLLDNNSKDNIYLPVILFNDNNEVRGPLCPKCKSTMMKKYFFFGKMMCIHPKCGYEYNKEKR